MIAFFDTNILVYMLDHSASRKQDVAIDCFSNAVHHDTIALSTQVLQEFYNITTRKLRPALSAQEAQQQVRHLCAFEVLGSAATTIMTAMDIVQRYQMQWWDALILEAALRAKADVLYTEDLQHGQRFGALTVVNPFLASAPSTP
ncbi:MAG: VapC toxin family PIN domain ribonuclease [Comamonadaceae bacterium CG17_big_fil_post_rev_8_21_14_2_50_60_13]|nr:MAG: VapC toxin family PIN domain ribonuclease [Comamonadaceae bacterium CG17_big_fil_post_rev_8_21_14_2_50_60_13]